MKTHFYIICALFTFSIITARAQKFSKTQRFPQNLHGPKFYEANKGTQFKIIEFKKGANGGFTEVLSNEFKLAPSYFFFKTVTIKKHDSLDYKIIEISFPNFEPRNNRHKNKNSMADSIFTAVKSDSTPSSPYINGSDNGAVFWMREDDFNELKNNGYIRNFYRRKYPSFAYGAAFSVPFKMRPETAGQNLKITPEIALGGYAGCRIRLSRYSEISVTLPVITLGVSTIGINDNNTLVDNPNPQDKSPDALVLGRTVSVGLLFQYNQFQIGLIKGWDKASGEVGRNWIYNDKPWYSFSIGYNFLNL